MLLVNYIATGPKEKIKQSIESLIQSLNFSSVACKGLITSASTTDVAEYLLDTQMLSKCKSMTGFVMHIADKAMTIENIFKSDLKWVREQMSQAMPDNYLLIHRPYLFALDTIHNLVTEANKYPDIDCICCKEIKMKEVIPQVRFNKMSKSYKDMPNMAGACMPMIRRAAGIEENLRGNTSIIVQKAIVKSL